jgi:hypothetical protein
VTFGLFLVGEGNENSDVSASQHSLSESVRACQLYQTMLVTSGFARDSEQRTVSCISSMLLASELFGEQMAEPKWKRFEKLIHQLHTQFAPEGAVVTLDDKILGCESKTERQLDVTIRAIVAQYKVLIVVECKDEARPIDVGTMGEFASLLRDVKANKGVMISTSGFTPAAVEMARA